MTWKRETPVFVPKHRKEEFFKASESVYEALSNSPYDEWEWVPWMLTEGNQIADHMGAGWTMIQARTDGGPWTQYVLIDFLKKYRSRAPEELSYGS